MRKSPDKNRLLTPLNTPCQKLDCTLFRKAGIEVWIKLDYQNHPQIQGNKLHKLRYNLNHALTNGFEQILTFGGAYSNHIAATAAACNQLGLKSIGIIRGEELAGRYENWSHTLQQAQQNGMQFEFVSRKDYRRRSDAVFLTTLQSRYPNALIVPEGGTNPLAVAGFDTLCEQLHTQVPNWSHLYCPVGTGGTLAGLVANFQQMTNLPAGQNARNIIGIAVLNQAEYLIDEIKNLIQPYDKKQVNEIHWEVKTHYAAGGYGKVSAALRSFRQRFERQFEIPLDDIYTAKLMRAVYLEIKQGHLPAGAKVVVLHTGGLKGNGRTDQPHKTVKHRLENIKIEPSSPIQ